MMDRYFLDLAMIGQAASWASDECVRDPDFYDDNLNQVACMSQQLLAEYWGLA